MNCSKARLLSPILASLSAGLIVPPTTVSPTWAGPINAVAIGGSSTAGYMVGANSGPSGTKLILLDIAFSKSAAGHSSAVYLCNDVGHGPPKPPPALKAWCKVH
jgi:hypothetical protein